LSSTVAGKPCCRTWQPYSCAAHTALATHQLQLTLHAQVDAGRVAAAQAGRQLRCHCHAKLLHLLAPLWTKGISKLLSAPGSSRISTGLWPASQLICHARYYLLVLPCQLVQQLRMCLPSLAILHVVQPQQLLLLPVPRNASAQESQHPGFLCRSQLLPQLLQHPSSSIAS
jgi:hypothetical protein